MKFEEIWKKTLSSDEKVEFEFSVGDGYRRLGLIVWGLIGLALLSSGSIGIFIFLIALFYYGYYLKVANAFAFTNKRVLIHRGWLSTHTISVDYSKITDVHVTEPFFEKMLANTGNIAINTAGTTTDQIMVRHVQSPYEIKKQLDGLKDR